MNIQLNQPYSFTQLGRRANQEDSRYPDSDAPKDAQPFFVVCDGVGGSEKGEVASRTVCSAFGKALAGRDWSSLFTVTDFEKALDFAFSELKRVSTPENKGMATTLTFVAFHSGGCFIAHIGDSRVYYVRPGAGIVYRTEDHSLVNALVRAGVITEKEAETHPDRNVITRSVCVPGEEQERSSATVVNITDVRKGDYVFMCSDGVLKRLSDDRLVELLSSDRSDAEKCAQIASMSVDSDDNNTAYLVSVGGVEGAAPVEPDTTTRFVATDSAAPARKGKKKMSGMIVSAVVAAVVVAVLAFVVVSWLKGGDADKEEAKSERIENGTASTSNATMPIFKGDLQKFFEVNLKYPADATKQGSVVVEIAVDDDGEVDDVKVVRGVEPALDKEAERICRMMRFEAARDADGNAVDGKVEQKIAFKRHEAPAPAVAPAKKETKPANAPGNALNPHEQQQEPVSEAEALKRRQQLQKQKEKEAEKRKIEQITGQPVQSI